MKVQLSGMDVRALFLSYVGQVVHNNRAALVREGVTMQQARGAGMLVMEVSMAQLTAPRIGTVDVEMRLALLEMRYLAAASHAYEADLVGLVHAVSGTNQVIFGPFVNGPDGQLRITTLLKLPEPSCHNLACTRAGERWCETCKRVAYCSETCQRADWPHHRRASPTCGAK